MHKWGGGGLGELVFPSLSGAPAVGHTFTLNGGQSHSPKEVFPSDTWAGGSEGRGWGIQQCDGRARCRLLCLCPPWHPSATASGKQFFALMLRATASARVPFLPTALLLSSSYTEDSMRFATCNPITSVSCLKPFTGTPVPTSNLSFHLYLFFFQFHL